MNCPFCGAPALCRTSEEVTPTLRRLYYDCPDFDCGARWAASLQVENTVRPSGLATDYRKPRISEAKPPGAEWGQMPLLDLISPPQKPDQG